MQPIDGFDVPLERCWVVHGLEASDHLIENCVVTDVRHLSLRNDTFDFVDKDSSVVSVLPFILTPLNS